MTQRVRNVENVPEEVVELAEAAARLIEENPANRLAFRELAAALGATASMATPAAAATGANVHLGALELATMLPAALAAFAARLKERAENRLTGALPRVERLLWEDAGASFDNAAVEDDAVRAATAFADLVARSIESDGAVATVLGVDRSRVSQRIREQSLYSFNRGDVRYYPRWQFVGDATLPGLRDVLQQTDETLHPLVVDHWFTTPSVDLEVDGSPTSPVTWLATSGSSSVVAELARDL